MPEEVIPSRKIIHIDMDAFYASVEQMDFPELKGKPLAVGGSEERGVVVAASYEARAFNVYSALASSIAKKRCPDLIFVPPRFDRYKEISIKIREIFLDYTDLVEPLSLDEAFLDVTHNKKGIPSATIIAKEIRRRILDEVGLTASAGISINKFTAKIASNINKPNGQKTIPPREVISFLESLPIEKFFGIGKVTAKKMNLLGVFNGLDLKRLTEPFLRHNFGKIGKHFYQIVRGIQESEVQPNKITKSLAAECTFNQDITTLKVMLEKLHEIADELEARMIKSNVNGKTITLKIKYDDFSLHTRSKTIPDYYQKKVDFFPVVQILLEQEIISKPVRLLGITISGLNNEIKEEHETQLKLAF